MLVKGVVRPRQLAPEHVAAEADLGGYAHCRPRHLQGSGAECMCIVMRLNSGTFM